MVGCSSFRIREKYVSLLSKKVFLGNSAPDNRPLLEAFSRRIEELLGELCRSNDKGGAAMCLGQQND